MPGAQTSQTSVKAKARPLLLVSLGAIIVLVITGVSLAYAFGGSSAPSATCAHDKEVFRAAFGYSGPLSCRKAAAYMPLLKAGRQGQTTDAAPSGTASPSFEPMPSPEPPGNARNVMTDNGILQWQQAGTTITSLWMDLESGINVNVEGASLSDDPSQGVIVVSLANQDFAEPPTINGYTGGTYDAPGGVGPLTLTQVEGSLTESDMLIYFNFTGGTGSLNPTTGTFVMNTST